MFFNIYREVTDHLPGQEIGEKDLMMSRMTDNETLDSERILRVCLSLTASLMIDMNTPILHALFMLLCDPSIQLLHEAGHHHDAFQNVYAIVNELVL